MFKNGNNYSMSLIKNKTQGWHIYERSTHITKVETRVPRVLGRTLGWGTTLYSAFKFIQNPTLENGIGTGAGIATLIYWPFAAVDFAATQYYDAGKFTIDAVNTLERAGKIKFHPENTGTWLWGDRTFP